MRLWEIASLAFAETSADKEQWEPVMESLYALQVQSESGAEPQAVREAWAFDWQSHGESAVLNEEALKDGPASACMLPGDC